MEHFVDINRFAMQLILVNVAWPVHNFAELVSGTKSTENISTLIQTQIIFEKREPIFLSFFAYFNVFR